MKATVDPQVCRGGRQLSLRKGQYRYLPATASGRHIAVDEAQFDAEVLSDAGASFGEHPIKADTNTVLSNLLRVRIRLMIVDEAHVTSDAV